VTALLRFDNVTLGRGGRILLENFDLELRAGEALQVTGPNGSGKSSLIRLAAGLLKPLRGHVDRCPCALADDHVALDREQPLRNALRLWVRAPDEALDCVGLLEFSHVPVRLLSSGQLKRASLARVVASAAPLWLLDEPLNALDRISAERFLELLNSHVSGGGLVIIASHQPVPGPLRKLDLG